MKLHHRVAIGLVAGTLVGVLGGSDAAMLEPLGTLFIKLIRMIVVPLVASSLITAVAGLPGRGVMGRMGVRAFGFIITSLFVALVIGIVVGHVLQPGASLSASARAELLDGNEAPVIDPEAPRPSMMDTLLAVIPDNPIRAAAEGNVLQILLVSILFGLAASTLSDDLRKPIVDLAESVSQALFKLTSWILELAPFGIFGIMAAVVGRSGLSVLVGLSYYVVVVVLALAIHIVVYSVILRVFAQESVSRFFDASKPALLIAFATCSTAAALPVSMSSMRNVLGLPARVVSFVLPLGAAVGRDGSAIYQAISVMFIAQVYGAHLQLGDFVILIVTAMLSSLAVASVPAASFVNLAILLTALGLPLEGAALVLGVERPLDMVRSSTNLIGHLVNASWVGATTGAASLAPADSSTD